MFPTAAIATATQRKILRVLAEKNRQYTLAELADLCHRSEATISRAIHDANRYPFIDKTTISGSRRLTFRLDPESQYTAAIRDFFEVEYDRERQNGSVPVDVWNLLEDVTARSKNEWTASLSSFCSGPTPRETTTLGVTSTSSSFIRRPKMPNRGSVMPFRRWEITVSRSSRSMLSAIWTPTVS